MGVAATLDAFLTAFENLQWDEFRAFFAEDACVFFPSATTPQEFCGRAAVEGRFKIEFESIRQSADGPPYMELRPEGLNIRLFDDAALVFFELRNAQRHGRRSIVLQKEDGDWKIVHLHASNVPWPDAPRVR